jgi:DNA-binding transcriptional LysR family regulator
MTTSEPGWDLYRTFLGALSEGSLSSAARALGLTQPTVGRHIDELERSLGQKLFVRSRNGLAPTEAALALRPHAETLAANAAALLRAASSGGEAVRGTVRIAASDVIGVEVLPAILTTLRRRQPGIAIELALSNEIADLLRRDADVAVRMVEPQQEALVVRKVGAIKVGLHAHRQYLKRFGTPATLEDLAGHTAIGFDRETAPIRSMQRRWPALRRDMFALRADSDLAQLAAIRAGFGIGACQVALARRSKDLVRVLPKAVELNLDTSVAMHESLRANRACRAVFDALVEGLQGYVREQDRRAGPRTSRSPQTHRSAQLQLRSDS